jgi:uncharacterized membrane protein
MRRRVRRPVAAIAAWSTGLSCAVTPWLLEPPPWVRLLASLLAAATAWAVVRALGGLAAAGCAVLRGEGRPVRLTASLALLLAVSGCGGAAPSVARAAVPTFVSAAAVAAPATGPVRVQVPLAAAATDAGRARVAVEELVRAGGLARSTVLVAVPTGSGWLDWSGVAALERLTRGDVATVTVQYAARPSWVEYLLDRGRATRSATAVLSAVRAELATLPAQRRPRLLVFGESLGATAAAEAVRQVGPVDGCLLAGLPGSADEPRVPGCTEVRNDDDPIPWWRAELLVAPRAGLPWLPIATFWQVTGAMVVSLDQSPGHGHRYGAALGPAWAGLVQSTRSSAAPTTVSVSRP